MAESSPSPAVKKWYQGYESHINEKLKSKNTNNQGGSDAPDASERQDPTDESETNKQSGSKTPDASERQDSKESKPVHGSVDEAGVDSENGQRDTCADLPTSPGAPDRNIKSQSDSGSEGAESGSESDAAEFLTTTLQIVAEDRDGEHPKSIDSTQ